MLYFFIFLKNKPGCVFKVFLLSMWLLRPSPIAASDTRWIRREGGVQEHGEGRGMPSNTMDIKNTQRCA